MEGSISFMFYFTESSFKYLSLHLNHVFKHIVEFFLL